MGYCGAHFEVPMRWIKRHSASFCGEETSFFLQSYVLFCMVGVRCLRGSDLVCRVLDVYRIHGYIDMGKFIVNVVY